MKLELPKMNGQSRSLALAFGGAILAAVATMLLPISLLEGITGTTGLSEMIPAMAAPLGDTARALIAFATGVVAFALLAAWQTKKAAQQPVSAAKVSQASPESVTDVDEPQEKNSLFVTLRAKIEEIFAQVRGNSGEGADLANPPKLRTRDIHPDAPARRPISAIRDLAEMETRVKEPVIPEVELPYSPLVKRTAASLPLDAPAAVDQVQPVREAPTVPVAPTAPVTHVAQVAVPPTFGEVPVAKSATDDASESLAAMVAKLEEEMARRQQQLQRLEAIARAVAPETQLVQNGMAVAQLETAAEPSAPVIEPAIERRLEAVESTGSAMAQPRSGDDALRSALETLHRMNARSR